MEPSGNPQNSKDIVVEDTDKVWLLYLCEYVIICMHVLNCRLVWVGVSKSIIRLSYPMLQSRPRLQYCPSLQVCLTSELMLVKDEFIVLLRKWCQEHCGCPLEKLDGVILQDPVQLFMNFQGYYLANRTKARIVLHDLQT